MNRLKNSLTRKIGPFAAWIWLAIFGGAMYWYRRHTAGASGGGDQGQGGSGLSYYGPYGQDAYPIQGGLGTGPGPGDSGTGAGTDTSGGNTNGGPPVINIDAPPTAPGANGNSKPRTQKPQPKHKIKKPKKPPGKTKRSSATTKHQGRTKNVAHHDTKPSRTRTHPSAPTHPATKGGHPPAHSSAPTHPATKAKGSTKPATRKVTRR